MTDQQVTKIVDALERVERSVDRCTRAVKDVWTLPLILVSVVLCIRAYFGK